MDTGQADMGNQGNRQGDMGTNKGGDRVRTEGLQQRQGETDKVTGEVTG